MEHCTIECPLAADRDALTVILIHGGYTVRHVKEKRPGRSGYVHLIEYWREERRPHE